MGGPGGAHPECTGTPGGQPNSPTRFHHQTSAPVPGVAWSPLHLLVAPAAPPPFVSCQVSSVPMEGVPMLLWCPGKAHGGGGGTGWQVHPSCCVVTKSGTGVISHRPPIPSAAVSVACPSVLGDQLPRFIKEADHATQRTGGQGADCEHPGGHCTAAGETRTPLVQDSSRRASFLSRQHKLGRVTHGGEKAWPPPQQEGAPLPGPKVCAHL